ncbi:MAG: hypothetical protein JW889_09650 [Verrucomicrobia bacterium]|nr:hypothetical protein [Verrucomicrobiota bacterium]
MDSRDRTFLALDHEAPDRVPLDLWFSSGFARKLTLELNVSVETFLDTHDVDLRYIAGPAYIGPPLRRLADGSDEDIWGVCRRRVEVPVAGGVETYRELAWSPLAGAETVEAVDAYTHWPSPDWFDYSVIEAQCEQVRSAGRIAVFMGDRLNRIAQLKPAMYLRGVEQILVDMSASPELAAAIFSKIRAFYRAYAERIFEAACGKLDLVLTGDDFGSQNGPLVSPAMWLEYLADGFAEYTRIAHSFGLRVMHHTCGSVRQLIPHMIERGLDVLQSLQPEAADMDARVLKAEFGDRLAFHGGISIQRTLPFGRPEDVAREARDTLDALAHGGGYILGASHNVQADTPVENLLALLDAHRHW